MTIISSCVYSDQYCKYLTVGLHALLICVIGISCGEINEDGI